jgi:hypothetical protein
MEHARTVKTKKQGRKIYKGRSREGLQKKKIPSGAWMSLSGLSVVLSGRQRSLRRADPSFTGAVSTVMCHLV